MNINKYNCIRFLRNNWLQIILILLALYILNLIYAKQDNFGSLISLLITTISAFFLLQKHKWDKKKIFYEIFTDFNSRYDRLNEFLNRIKEGKDISINYYEGSKSSKSEEVLFNTRNIIYDYLNLCSEEYFWYNEGMIHSMIWENWKKGIEYFISSEAIKDIIKKERILYSSKRGIGYSDNYYGFLSSDIVNNVINIDK